MQCLRNNTRRACGSGFILPSLQRRAIFYVGEGGWFEPHFSNPIGRNTHGSS
jgi:hypothetical protein